MEYTTKDLLNKISFLHEILSFEAVCYLNDLVSKIDNEKHRHYHNINHIVDLYTKCVEDEFKIIKISNPNINNTVGIFIYFALFHDADYYIDKSSNEIDSAERWDEFCKKYGSGLNEDENKYIHDSILASQVSIFEDSATKYEQYPMVVYDRIGILYNVVDDTNLRNIIKEYEIYDWSDFANGHLKIAKYIINSLMHISNFYEKYTFDDYVRVVDNLKPKTLAIYCGSFNPFHVGHNDILNKTKRLFDKVVIANGQNSDKGEFKYNSVINKNYVMSRGLNGNEVIDFTGSIFDLYNYYKTRYDRVVFVRGFRDSKDVEYDMSQVRAIEDFIDYQVVFIPCNREHSHVSSSMIRKLDELHMDTSKYLVI